MLHKVDTAAPARPARGTGELSLTDVPQRLRARSDAAGLEALEASLFHRILAASLIAVLGSFMQSVGAAWLMVSIQAGPFYVARRDALPPAPLRPPDAVFRRFGQR